MGKSSRTKGAQGERDVAKLLHAELGMTFARRLSQYQQSGQDDLTCDDPGFPFSIEVKRYAKGWTCRPAWECQAFDAARGTGKHPCVIYRFDGQQWRARIWIDAVAEALGTQAVSGVHMDTDLQGFAWFAREIMARRAIV